MLLPLLVLAVSAGLVGSRITGSDEMKLESKIRRRVVKDPKFVYVRTWPQRKVLHSEPNDKVEDLVRAIGTISAADVRIYVGATDQKRIMHLISLVDEHNLAGKFWSVKIVRDVRTDDEVHGPAETIKWAIENRKINFIGSSLPTFNLQTPREELESKDKFIEETFEAMRAQVVRGYLNIIVCPEFFFNNICYHRDEKGTLLANKDVENILSQHQQCFGRVSNVISVLSFLHGFDRREIPDWLQGWEMPGWTEEQRKAHSPDEDGIFGEKDFHVANYQLFIWNQEKLAVYRKGCYYNEITWGQYRKELKNGFMFEFGNWETAIVAKSGLSEQVAQTLFGSGLVVPRICADMTLIHGDIEVGQGAKSLGALDVLSGQLQNRGLLLVTAASLSPRYVCDVCEKVDKEVTGILVDCYADRLMFCGEESFETGGEDVGKIPYGNIMVRVLRLPQRKGGNTALRPHRHRMRRKELRAAVYHLTKFISRRLHANHQLDNFVGGFAFSKKLIKRMRYKELKATLHHLSRFIRCHHKRRVGMPNNCAMLRCAKTRHKRARH